MTDLGFRESEINRLEGQLRAVQEALQHSVDEFNVVKREYDATRVHNLELQGQLYVLRQALESIRLIERKAHAGGPALRTAEDAVATQAGRATVERIRKLEGIMRDVAELEPISAEQYGCFFCNSREGGKLHERDCVWARARAARDADKLGLVVIDREVTPPPAPPRVNRRTPPFGNVTMK